MKGKMIFVRKNVSEPELAQHVSKKKKKPFGRIIPFPSTVQNLTVFSIIEMIRIRFFEPGELFQKGFRAAQYGNGARRGEEHERTDVRRYNEGVQAAGKGHTLGPPQIWAWGGLIAGLQKQEAAVGAGNAAILTGCLKQLDGMSMDNEVRGSAGSIGRANPSKLASPWQSTGQVYETQS